MIASVIGFLVQFPVVTLFGVIGIGYLLGQLPIFGFRLGVAGVLFTGLAVGALSPDVALPPIVSTVGLILFIYSIGIQFGPGFQNPLRPEGRRDNLFSLAMLLVGPGLAIGVAAWLTLPGPTLAGLFSGSLTNAPALAAAQEVIRDNHIGSGDRPVIAFGIAYPFGVLGVMLSFQLYRVMFGATLSKTEAAEAIEVHDYVVQNPGVCGQNLNDVLRLHKDLGFVISRMQQ